MSNAERAQVNETTAAFVGTDRRARLERHRERARQARTSFEAYCKFCAPWPLADHQWHFMAPVGRLLLNSGAKEILAGPPQWGKTSITTILGDQFLLGASYCNDPICDIRSILLNSYNYSKAAGLSKAVMRAFDDPGHPARLVFPEVRLREGGAEQWCLNKQRSNEPTFVAVGLGGGTGYPAQLIQLDDYVKGFREARSQAYQDAIEEWWRGSMLARMQPHTRAEIGATRWGEFDFVANRLRERFGQDAIPWRYTRVPAMLGSDDERRPLWAERYPLEFLDEQLVQLGPRDFNTLYMARPTGDKGDVWDRPWFTDNLYDPASLPELHSVFTAWDCASKDGDKNDYTAWVRMGIDARRHVYVLACGRFRVQWPDLVRKATAGVGGAGPTEAYCIEDKDAGQQLIQALRGGKRPITEMDAKVSKELRAVGVSPMVEGGMVHLPRGDAAAEALIAECTAFPRGQHDDQHDAFVIGLRRADRLRGGLASVAPTQSASQVAAQSRWGNG